MNVTLLPNAYLPGMGGIEMTTCRIAQELLKRKHKVNIITSKYLDSKLKSYELMDDIPVNRISILPRSVSLPQTLALTKYNAYKIARLLRKYRTEVLHVQSMGYLAPSTLLTTSIGKFKLIITLHSSANIVLRNASSRNPAFLKLLRLAFLKLLRRADYITAVSQNVLESYQAMVPLIKRKCKVIPNGIDLNEFAYKKKYRHSRRYLLSVANFYPSKGVDLLIMAFKDIAAMYEDLDLIIVGGNPNKDVKIKESCMKLANLLGIKDRTVFLGQLKDRKRLVELYNGCEFFVLPSRCEGFGIVNLEAMAAGKAIVATKAGGVPEIIKNNINGILVEPKSVKASVNGMVRLLENPYFKAKLGKRGKEMVETYRWENVIEEYLDVYGKLVGR